MPTSEKRPSEAIKFYLDPQSRSPYPVQVVRQAAAQVFAGRLHPGDRLPSVRQLARELHISRTTAERIHEALCDSMLAEMRPRSGAFVAAPEAEQLLRVRSMLAIYEFLKQTAAQALRLGLDTDRLAQLLTSMGRLQVHGEIGVCFPLVATRDFYECVEQSLGDNFPARLVYIPPTGLAGLGDRRVLGARFVLSSYYMRARAKRVAEALRCPLLYLRYNTSLLDEWMDIPSKGHRTLLTRDRDNAESIKIFLSRAYPEVPSQCYRVEPVTSWLKDPSTADDDEPVWVTITAQPFVKRHPKRERVRLLHPLLADDFIDELRCLALLG